MSRSPEIAHGQSFMASASRVSSTAARSTAWRASAISAGEAPGVTSSSRTRSVGTQNGPADGRRLVEFLSPPRLPPPREPDEPEPIRWRTSARGNWWARYRDARRCFSAPGRQVGDTHAERRPPRAKIENPVRSGAPVAGAEPFTPATGSPRRQFRPTLPSSARRSK
jgi:hypothetical protein